jgi:hypothetical protein
MSLWDAVVTVFWFMLLVAWFWLVISIIADIFRDDSLGGWGKAAWCIFVILLPWVGVLTYMIARGRTMGERSYQEAVRREEALDARVRSVAVASMPATTGTGIADELGRLADLVESGRITPSEYEAAKRSVLGGASSTTGALRPVASDGQA